MSAMLTYNCITVWLPCVLAWILVGACSGLENDRMLDILVRLDALEEKGREQAQMIAHQNKRIAAYEASIDKLESLLQKYITPETTDTDSNHGDAPEAVPIPTIKPKSSSIQKGRVPVRRFVMEGAETVAFHATFDGVRRYESLTIGQTVDFPNVKLNLGGGFHPNTSLFIAPMPGIYLFSLSVMDVGVTNDIHLDIYKNNVDIASAYASDQGNLGNQGSVTVVVQLETGDEIFVKVQRPNNSYLWGDKLTSFTGVLITSL